MRGTLHGIPGRRKPNSRRKKTNKHTNRPAPGSARKGGQVCLMSGLFATYHYGRSAAAPAIPRRRRGAIHIYIIYNI